MKRRIKAALLSVIMCAQLVFTSADVQAATTLYNNETGKEDGYDYELWKDYGTTSMTLNGGGAFSCSWSNIGNALFRKGIKFDSTKTYQQLGNISVDYGCNYQPNGNSYLCVYGWTVEPLVEYYVVDSWGTWRPPGATPKGQITVDGGTYDVYETTRVNQPSIKGDTTFQQYWSVRTSKRTSGTISVSDHFKAWERMGMKCGKLYETALNVEGYQSSGNANVYKNNITIGGSGNNNQGNQGGNNNQGNTGNNQGNATTSGDAIQCENMTISGQYAGKISSPFNGVALYANDDAVSYTQYFANDTHDFSLRGCSNNNNMARVDLKIGGQNKGTFYFGDEYPAEYTIKNVKHGTGNQKVELVVTADDGKWDAYVDSLKISGISVEKNNQNNDQGNQGENAENNQGNAGTASNVNTKSTIQCESMSLSGQYVGKIDSPFTGVALYANNDTASITQRFGNGTHNFTLRGCSNNSNMARVDLKIGGENKGTFYFGDEYPAEYTLKNVSHKTGDQKIELVVTADDGKWDAYIDYLKIDAAGSTDQNTDTTPAPSQKPIDASTKMVALTFDDGPTSTTTQVLDVLEKYDAVATFFLIGNQVNNNTKSIMQRQINMGCELANHSYSHQDMSRMSAYEVQQEINRTASAIKNTVNYDAKFFRPPYLATSNTMYQNIKVPFIQGIACDDWVSSTSAWSRANTVLNNVSDGTIILLHDFQGNSQTVEALPTIIEGLKKQGYTFVTVSQLFEYKGINPNVGYKIWTNVYK